MKQKKLLFGLLALCFLFAFSAYGQYKAQGFEVGLYGGGAIGLNESDTRPMKLQGRLSVGFPIFDPLQGVFGAGYVRNEGEGYTADLFPIDFRCRYSPFFGEHVIPYLISLCRHWVT